MFAAPILTFVTTHILYLNFYALDYGWNMEGCVVMGIIQLLMWAIWAGMKPHPHRSERDLWCLEVLLRCSSRSMIFRLIISMWTPMHCGMQPPFLSPISGGASSSPMQSTGLQ